MSAILAGSVPLCFPAVFSLFHLRIESTFHSAQKSLRRCEQAVSPSSWKPAPIPADDPRLSQPRHLVIFSLTWFENTANSTFDIHTTLTPPGTTNTLFVLDIKKSWPGLIWIASDEIWPIEDNLQRRFVPNHTASCFQQKGPLRFLEHNLSWSLFARLSAGLDLRHRGLCPDPSPARAERKHQASSLEPTRNGSMCERISLYYLYNVLRMSLPADGICPTICSAFDSLKVICSQLRLSPLEMIRARGAA